jgi:hypothetical protein
LAASAAGALFHEWGPINKKLSAVNFEFDRQMESVADPGRNPVWTGPKTTLGATAVQLLNKGATPALPPALLPSSPSAFAGIPAAPPTPTIAQVPAPRPAPAVVQVPAPSTAPVLAQLPAPSPARLPQPPNRASGHRIFYGVVYDLATGQPIPGARIKFYVKETGRLFGIITTDGSGQYLLTLPHFKWSEDDYLSSVQAPGYREGQIEDPDPSYLERPIEDRQRALRELVDGNLDPIPLRYPDDDDLIRLNFALVPDAPAAPK